MFYMYILVSDTKFQFDWFIFIESPLAPLFEVLLFRDD